MELTLLIERFVGRFVRVSIGGHKSYVGTLAAVYADCVRLENSLAVSDLEEDSWSQRMYGSDPDFSDSNRDAETIIHLHCIGSVTCLDDTVPPPREESAESGSVINTNFSNLVFSDRAPDVTHAPESSSDDVNELALEDRRIAIEIGADLLRLVDPARDGDLLDRISGVRSQVARDLGLVLPTVRVRDSLHLSASRYRIQIAGCTVGRGDLQCDRLLAIGKPIAEESPTRDPVFGVPAQWIAAKQRDTPEFAMATIVEPAAVVATHLTHLVHQFAATLISYDMVHRAVETLRETAPALVNDLVPNVVPIRLLHQILSRLLEEGVPIRHLEVILESIGHNVAATDVEELLRMVRIECGHLVVANHCDEIGVMRIVALDDGASCRLEELLAADDYRVNITNAIGELRKEWQEQTGDDGWPILIRNGKLRRRLWQLLNQDTYTLIPVISTNELPRLLPIETVGTIGSPESGAHTWTPDEQRPQEQPDRPLPR